MQRFKRFTLGLMALFVLMVLLLGLLMTTTPGLRVCVEIAKHFVPEISVKAVSGNLFSAQLEDFRYQNAQVTLEVKNIAYKVNWRQLKDLNVDLSSFVANSVNLKTPISGETLTTSPLLSVKTVSGEGVMNFSEGTKGNFHIQTDDIASETLIPDARLRLSGEFQVSGELQGEQWSGVLGDINYQGLLNKAKVSLTGGAKANSDGWISADNLKFSVGENCLTMNGRVNPNKTAPRVALEALLKAPNLSVLMPQWQGQLQGRVTMVGNDSQPVVQTWLEAKNLKMPGVALKKVRFDGHASNPSLLTGEGTVEILGLKSSGATLSQGKVRIAGDEKSHRITIDGKGDPIATQATLVGHYDRALSEWTVNIEKSRIDANRERLQLLAPTQFTWKLPQSQLTLQPQCWGYKSARLCLSKETTAYLDGAQAFPVNVTLADFNLKTLNGLTQAPLELNGILNAEAKVMVPRQFKGMPQGNVNLTAKQLAVLLPTTENAKPIEMDQVRMDAALAENEFDVKALMQLKRNGSINLNARIKDPEHTRALSGEVTVDEVAMRWLESFLPPEEHVNGQMKAHLTLGGTLTDPRLYGALNISQFKVDSVSFPFEMQPSQLSMNFNGNQSDLTAELKTQKGDMRLVGEARWNGLQDVNAQLRLTSDRIQVMVSPMAVLDLGTNVTCKISPNALTLDGVVRVPWARIKVKELPEQVVKVSDDVVRLDLPQQSVKNTRTLPLKSNLFIEIGDDVEVSAMGLNASLTGRLQVVQDQNRLGLNGQIHVPKGTFRAYGQALDVRKGTVTFINSVDNPQLAIEAIRSPEKTADNVTVGIRVEGTVKEPKVSVFSDPAMSQGQAFSYLLSGEGLEAAGNNDGRITAALLGLGINQGNQVLGAIGEVVGIEDLQLDTEGVGDSSQLIVSGYVLPGLKVKYGVGLFDSLSTLTLRYQVIPKLYLEVVSGVDQALDVLYQFEFN